MAQRVLVVALLAPMLALMRPVPASAHVGVSFSIGLPFFGLVAGVPGPFYGPPVYPAPVFAPPAYVAGPVYAPAPVYGPPVIYAPRRVFVPAYRRFALRPYYGPRVIGRRPRRW